MGRAPQACDGRGHHPQVQAAQLLAAHGFVGRVHRVRLIARPIAHVPVVRDDARAGLEAPSRQWAQLQVHLGQQIHGDDTGRREVGLEQDPALQSARARRHAGALSVGAAPVHQSRARFPRPGRVAPKLLGRGDHDATIARAEIDDVVARASRLARLQHGQRHVVGRGDEGHVAAVLGVSRVGQLAIWPSSHRAEPGANAVSSFMASHATGGPHNHGPSSPPPHPHRPHHGHQSCSPCLTTSPLFLDDVAMLEQGGGQEDRWRVGRRPCAQRAASGSGVSADRELPVVWAVAQGLVHQQAHLGARGAWPSAPSCHGSSCRC